MPSIPPIAVGGLVSDEHSNLLALWGHIARGYAASGYMGLVSYDVAYPRIATDPQLHGLVDISAGYATLMVRADGSLLASGGNGYGQLGLGYSGETVLAPTPVALPARAVQVAAGGGSSLVLLANDPIGKGRVLGMGGNKEGSLGTGDEHTHWTPEYVETADGEPLENIVQIARGKGGFLLLDASGNPWIVGHLGNEGAVKHTFAERLSKAWPALAELDGKTVELATGFYASVARLSDASVRTWGGNEYGQWGVNTITEPNAPEAQSVHHPSLPAPAVALAAGLYNWIAVCADGKAYVCGRNDLGQSGISRALRTSEGLDPARISKPTDVGLSNVVGAASFSDLMTGTAAEGGAPHSVFWTVDGSLYSTGGNVEGELGTTEWVQPKDTPQRSLVPGHVVKAVCGEDRTMAIIAAGTRPGAIASAEPGAPGLLIARFADTLDGGPHYAKDRVTSFTLETQRVKKPPVFAANGAGPGTVLARILPDPGNGGLLTLVEFTQLPVQGEAVLYGEGAHGENSFAGATKGMPINDKVGHPVGELLEALEQGVKVTQLVLAAGLTKALPVGTKIVVTNEEGKTQTYTVATEALLGAEVIEIKKATPNAEYPAGTVVETFKNGVIVAKTVLKERVEAAAPGRSAKWRLSLAAEKEVLVAEQVVLGGGPPEPFSAPVSKTLAETSHTFAAPLATAHWPRADPTVTVRITGLFAPDEPTPSSIIGQGGNWNDGSAWGAFTWGTPTSSNAVTFTPGNAGDGLPEPGYLFKPQRWEPFIYASGKTARGQYRDQPYAVGEWAFTLLGTSPSVGWICTKAIPVTDPTAAPPASFTAWTLAAEPTKLHVTQGESSLAVGMTVLSSSYAGGQTTLASNPAPGEWITAAGVSAEIKKSKPALMLASANPTSAKEHWEEVALHYEVVSGVTAWGNLTSPGTVGTPQTATVSIPRYKTGNARKPASPEYLEGARVSSVKVLGSYGNPAFAPTHASLFGQLEVQATPAGQKGVPEELTPPRFRNLSRAGAVRPKVGDVLEAIPGTWTGEGSGDPTLAITSRIYAWAHSNQLTERGEYEEANEPGEPFTWKPGDPNFPRYTVKAGDKGTSIRLAEYAVNSFGVTNTGGVSEPSRLVKE